MPTFLVFNSGRVTETIRGANPGALKTAVTRASSGSGAAGGSSSGSHFSSKGHRLGTEGDKTSQGIGGGLPSLDGLGDTADSMVRFMGLYFTTLFSLDAYAAAQASPLNVRNNRR
jgi:thioredoxin 1